jgi:putative redox protein
MEVSVEKEMASGPRRITTLRADVTMPVSLDASTRARLERAARHCPVDESIHPDIDVPITFHWPEEAPVA